MTEQAQRRSSGRPATRGAWAMRDRPSLVWLLLAFVLTLVHPFVPESRWLMVHVVLLGAVTHSILVWSTHFAQALLKTSEDLDPRRNQSLRLGMLMLGVAIVLVGVPSTLWPVTITGASLVVAAVLWHAMMLWRRIRRALPGRFRVTIHYYLTAALLLPIGVVFGVLLARGPADEQHARLLVAHSVTMVLGWLALTVTGTLITLWPTMLRTQVDPRAERIARRCLPVFVLALAGTVASSLAGMRGGVAAGLLVYAVTLLLWAVPLIRPALAAPPRQFSVWSVAAALAWLVATVLTLAWRAAHEPLALLAESYGPVAAMIVVGFALQVLTGALSYLIPSVIGGGSRVVRAGREWLERGAAARIIVINLGLLLCLLPVPSVVRVIVSTLVLLALAAFIPLLLKGIRACIATRRALAAQGGPPAVPAGVLGPERPSASSVQVLAALAALAVAVVAGTVAAPGSSGFVARAPGEVADAGGVAGAAAGGVSASGRSITIAVSARDMRFIPSRIEVPAGDRLVVELTNTDPSTTHDLSFGGTLKTPRLRPGATARLDVGVIGADTEGWCTIIGHRRMGMVLTVVVTGAAATATASASPAHEGGHEMAGAAGITGDDAPAAAPIDPVLAPLTDERVHKVTLTVTEVELEVAPGVRQRRWTYNGRVPGPTLHGRVGDVFEITLVNDGSMGHSIDFHAGALAPDRPMRTIPPGESLTYRFTATKSGIWMYHCSTMPMSAHIAAGMHGAVIIEPADLPRVDRSYVLVQSEAYVDGDGRSALREVDADAVAAEQPDAVVFNGIANQYDHQPLRAKVGERVRFWVLDAGPNRATSVHIVGAQFDTVYAEGAYLLGGPGAPESDGGSQALALQPAQGGFVETTFREAGHYPLVSHIMIDAERGAHAVVRVLP